MRVIVLKAYKIMYMFLSFVYVFNVTPSILSNKAFPSLMMTMIKETGYKSKSKTIPNPQ